MEDERFVIRGRSCGLSVASYDCRIDQDLTLASKDFALASTIERFNMPWDVCAHVKDKSSWAREGLGLFNTFIDPGWRGYLTLELVNHSSHPLVIHRGDPICQIIFEYTSSECHPYSGKYQNQEQGPQPARYENG